MPAGPRTDVDADVKPEVKVDDGLDKLYKTWQDRETQNNKQLVQIIRYVKKQKLSRAVIKATLQGRGLSEASVSSEVSRIISLGKDENEAILTSLEQGEITIAAARKAIAKPQDRPAISPTDKMWAKLIEAARIGFKASAEDPTFTSRFFTSEAGNAWNTVKEEAEEAERQAEAKRQAAMETGGEATGDIEEESLEEEEELAEAE